MSLVIYPDLIEFESQTGNGGGRVFYLGSPIVGLVMNVRPDASPDEVGMAKERAAHFLAEHVSFEDCLARLRAARLRLEKGQRLSPVEHDLLVQLGFGRPDVESDILEALAFQEQLVGGALTLAETSRLTGLEEADLRERLEEGRLLGVWCDGHHWRVLAFQVTLKGLLPGLNEILGRVPDDNDPLGLYAFFTTPQPTLLRQGRMVTPVEWLTAGADPAVVVDLARRF
ncbi:hypothetical protein [Palleronia sp.]|uniref:hypothetical protein n=1 Tax=Palleronia sp. TaxID=1940284 RepID=UPI0035C83A54